jgi:hypothetical protein
MLEPSEFEKRLTALEKEVEQLKELVRLAALGRRSYKFTIGSMNDFPEFEAVVRLGREIRKAMKKP